jgi:hypothetical protein
MMLLMMRFVNMHRCFMFVGRQTVVEPSAHLERLEQRVVQHEDHLVEWSDGMGERGFTSTHRSRSVTRSAEEDQRKLNQA